MIFQYNCIYDFGACLKNKIRKQLFYTLAYFFVKKDFINIEAIKLKVHYVSKYLKNIDLEELSKRLTWRRKQNIFDSTEKFATRKYPYSVTFPGILNIEII